MTPGKSLNTIVAIEPQNLACGEFALALALLSIGIPRDPLANGGDVVEFRETVAGKVQRRFEFVFAPDGIDGVDTAEWIKRWNDEAWLTANAAHPFAFLKAFAGNLHNFAGWMKSHSPVLVFRVLDSAGEGQRRERVAYVPEGLMDTDRGREILSRAGIAA